MNPFLNQYTDDWVKICAEWLDVRILGQGEGGWSVALADNQLRVAGLLEQVKEFTTRAAECDPGSEVFRLAVTLRNRMESMSRGFPKQCGPIAELMSDILSFQDYFQYDMGTGRKYDFHVDMFTAQLGNFSRDVAEYWHREGNQILEIGSHEGFSSCWMIENLMHGPRARITCVDRFDGAYYSVFCKNIFRTGKLPQINIIKGFSRDVLRKIDRNPQFDIVYVDDSHTASDALEDIVLSWPLLRIGGIMLIDDVLLWCSTTQSYPVQVAVEAFLKTNGHEVEVMRTDYQTTFRKKTGIRIFQ